MISNNRRNERSSSTNKTHLRSPATREGRMGCEDNNLESSAEIIVEKKLETFSGP
jgi:hypothetical protein